MIFYRFLCASYIRMPAATEALRDSSFPSIGILTLTSAVSISSRDTLAAFVADDKRSIGRQIGVKIVVVGIKAGNGKAFA